MLISIRRKINQTSWLDPNALDCFGFNPETPVHTIFELIFHNVCNDFKTPWRRVLRAERNKLNLYAARVTCYLLIDKALRKYKKLKNHEIVTLIGENNYDIINQYYSFY
jgi:hypothetical protein